jgi:hypothetical protein
MLNSFKRFISPPPASAPTDWSEVRQWAESQGLAFRRERGDRGFVLEGQAASQPPIGTRPWRLEWGPPQRDYLQGAELRIRATLGLPQELQMLLMTTALMDTLERDTFNRFTEQAQTEIDLAIPEEMRWLALFRRVNLQPWKTLRTQIGAVAAIAGTVEAWLQDSVLQAELDKALPVMNPLVLMTLRGRLYLRTRLDTPHLPTIGAAIALLNASAQALNAVLDSIGRRPGTGSVPSTESPEASSGWSTSDPPPSKDPAA